MIKEARIVDVEKVAVIGSGNWGTVIARMLGTNVVQQKGFDHEIKMWVYEEMVGERKLTELINEKHENVKYLPGVSIPENVIAVPDLLEAAEGATILVIVIPHQFVNDICGKLKGKVHPKAKAVSLVKGFDTTQSGIRPISHVIKEALKIPVCTLSGANLANEISEEKFSETTIGYKNRQEGELFKRLFETKYFKVGIVDDKELLNGQKLQGTLTAKEIYSVLQRKGLEKEFPLFTTVYKIVSEGLDPRKIVEDIV
ncbi:hypothetical protein RhiirA5_347453 [Rhizophagus irregularis]|uniref:Glycerol-3-phosphate dehydrogenase [NAD(+)] n=1 Tax=Rhizophagus irregularis TaxID=588596 RepID=A0A2N0QBY5_9GLOM|nr:hypothetical protein RhiirA5_347453 [Rhizophagus irregularis]